MSNSPGSSAWTEEHYGPHCDTGNFVTTKIFGKPRTVHKDAARLFLRLDHIFKEHAHGYYLKLCDSVDVGTFVCRKIANSESWSNHAFATAIDLRWTHNPSGTVPMSSEIWREASEAIVRARREGFRWGGDFSTTPDPMHLEVVVTPAPRPAP